MCGIYGTTRRYNENLVSSKLKRIDFRGPDYSCFKWFEDKVLLGQNRLSILDLDPRSNQPFTYHHIHIVFNGEIYNFKDLKNDLLDKGYTFTTSGDTEVICAAYLEYGQECTKYLFGMFAFVLYDNKQNILFGGRDRLGKKPLYISLQNNEIEFASQPSQIIIGNKAIIDDDAVCQYLAWGYVPDPKSIYQSIFKLKAGFCFSYNLTSREYSEFKYWEIDETTYAFNGSKYDDAKIELNQLLNEVVAQRLVADVPVGVFLSGGIDSSLVAAIAQKQSNQPIKTFSVAFDEAEYDESKYAIAVANKIGSDHTNILCSYKEGIEMIENITYFYDEPFADSSAIPSMLLAKHTKKYVTVALSGDGGDESFLGYERYNWMLKVQPIFKVPLILRKQLSILNLFGNYKLSTVVEGLQYTDINQAYIAMMSTAESYHTNLNKARNVDYVYELLKNKNTLERLSDFDLKTYINGDINTKVDRATMAFSLESRAPLMDHRIVEFARSLPTKYKYQNGVKKRILKDVLYRHLPKDIFDRPKAGFGVPLKHWFRNELKQLVLDNLTLNTLKNIPYIDAVKAHDLIQDHMLGKANRETMIWRLLIYKTWLDKK